MIPFSQARALALSVVEPALVARVPLFSAQGRFIAERVLAPRSLPAIDSSALDGYAVKSVETRSAQRDRPARFAVVDTIYTGSLPTRFINTGEAARIFTGAPMPSGADCVIRQEAVRSDGRSVEVFHQAEPFDYVRRRGEEVELSHQLFAPAQRVDAYVVGMLAALGLNTAPVRPRPRVSILTVGDELVAPGQNAALHHVYDSNGPLLAALAQDAGAEVVSVGRVADNDEAIRSALEKRLETSELVVTAGGASAGDKDRVKKVVQAMRGTLVFDGVAMRPGRPVAVGTVGGRPLAILPGSPGAAAVVFDQLVRPMILKRQGVKEIRRRIPSRLELAHDKEGGVIAFLSARLVASPDGGGPLASVPPQGAHPLYGTVGALGWVVLPAGKSRFEAGQSVQLELYDSATYEAT